MNRDTIKYIAGICCTLLCNILMVVGNYIMKGYDCSSADVTLFKGLFQMPIYGSVILYSLLATKSGSNKNQKRPVKDDNNDVKTPNDISKETREIKFLPTKFKDKAWTLAFGMLNGARYAAFYGAVLFMPMADYIVYIATTPIFSYIFSCLLIKTKLTILKTVLCVSVVIGISLVTQPPFLFGEDDKILSQEAKNISSKDTGHPFVAFDNEISSNLTKEGTLEETKFTSSYWIGVGLSFTFATAGAMCNVIPVKCKCVSTHTLMFWAGLGNVISSFLCLPLPKLELDTLFQPEILEWFQWIIVIVLGFLGVAINQLLMLANILSTPTVNSMTRRSEIILVLFIDMFYFNVYPNALKGIGYAIVLISVVGMAAANDLQKWMDKRFKSQPEVQS